MSCPFLPSLQCPYCLQAMCRKFCRLNTAVGQVGLTAPNKASSQVQGHSHYTFRDKNPIISA